MVKRKTLDEHESFRAALRMIAPGTQIREAISAILQARTGALLCFGATNRLSRLSEGGVKLDEEMTAQLLYELSKMDGAILINETGTRISYANRFLKPSSNYPTSETGTRHRAAQRFANQAKCLVLAISQRRSCVTLYCHSKRYVLDSVPTLINKGTQTLQILDKYVDTLHKTLDDLTSRELGNVVTIYDVCRVLQRAEMVHRIAKEVTPIIEELGTEGRLLDIQMQETLKPLNEVALILKDYHREKPGVTVSVIMERMAALPQEELMNLGTISQILGYGPSRNVDVIMSPRGYHVLHAINRLPAQIIDNLVNELGSLQAILQAPKEVLVEVEGVGDVMAERIRSGLALLANQFGPGSGDTQS
ncbi:MAG TPA: DNA integrity scanning diadenylate cyclase DisA [Candidatus Hydrogenedentes bacterium]|jgi:diadenylate cyclase|nr:MAG: DNA integrity scanning protein DisA [Candidatus Hydrogenedentes bacterium ADurb.Bin170]HNZ47797.1 DNA integrity scanning diadenylate cyclase DisA [Candidatus Hydrogenedentota bacterium]HOD95772.1 DNA integrity scanning diadenylate cyclase DisA [Candidatus Hydrogenedentota bacterium]HOM47860.1 DNA integrity scanning diadenylate cyclase DisA [Candidatus Hydrogenedentota bacterium]HOR51190.1 DNA integrity scanning diadenylate cyclase DisA [Candidatus Hydrogenedentota bacterium]